MRNRKFRTGFTLVEVLVALAITAILLTAVALAFNASMINYRENEDMFKAVNMARQALFRITSQLRTAEAVEPTSPANECTMITAEGDNITYRYDNSSDTLYLITNDDATDADYVLSENVAAMTFIRDVVVDGAVTKVRGVQISITVTIGTAQKKLSAASVVRRNLN